MYAHETMINKAPAVLWYVLIHNLDAHDVVLHVSEKHIIVMRDTLNNAW